MTAMDCPPHDTRPDTPPDGSLRALAGTFLADLSRVLQGEAAAAGDRLAQALRLALAGLLALVLAAVLASLALVALMQAATAALVAAGLSPAAAGAMTALGLLLLAAGLATFGLGRLRQAARRPSQVVAALRRSGETLYEMVIRNA